MKHTVIKYQYVLIYLKKITNTLDMFALLSQKDLDKAIKTEFESFCADKGYNPNVFETRYAVVNERENEERLKVIFVAENKIELNKQVQLLQNYRLSGAYPLPIAITTTFKQKIKAKKIV